MKRKLLSAAIVSTLAKRAVTGYRNWWGEPDFGTSPMIAKVRKCAQCKVGILSGRHCFSCSQTKRK